MRCIQEQARKDTTNRPCNRNRHEPGEHEQAHSLPVHSPESAVAETDTDGGTGDAHGGGDGERVLAEDVHGDGSANFH